MAGTTYNITPQPNNSYTGSASGILPNQQSNVLSGMTIPNQTQTQNSGLVSGGQNVQSSQPNSGLLPKDTTMTGVSTPPVVNIGGKSQVAKGSPSVVAQQKALNEANINTPGYIAIAEDGFYGDKTKAAFQQYGYNTQTGQKNNPTPTSTLTANTTANNIANYGANPGTPPVVPPVGAGGAATGTANNGSTGVNQGVLIGNLANQSQQPSQAYTDAQAAATATLGQETALQQDFAKQSNQIAGTAGFLTQQNGEQGLLQNQYNQGADALAKQYQGNTQQIANANTQQGLQVTAGTNAANANAPITGVPYGTQTISPSNVGGSSTGQVQPNDPFYPALQQAAQQAANGQISAVPSSITSNPVLNAQMNDMAKKINPNYNPVTSAAQSSVTANQTTQSAGYQSALQQGQNLAAQAKDLINTFGLNPSELNVANGAIQKIASNTSNPQYKMLNNYLADISSRYSQILTPAGGSSTDTTRAVASGMLDGLASGKSLQTVLDGLDQQAKAVIAGVPTPYGNSTTNGGGAPTWANYGG